MRGERACQACGRMFVPTRPTQVLCVRCITLGRVPARNTPMRTIAPLGSDKRSRRERRANDDRRDDDERRREERRAADQPVEIDRRFADRRFRPDRRRDDRRSGGERRETEG